MQLPNYLGNIYWLLLGAWIIISALLICIAVNNLNDFIYNDTDLSSGTVASAIMLLVLILTLSFLMFTLYFLKIKNNNTKYNNYYSHGMICMIIFASLNVISFIIMCMFVAYYTDSDIIEIKQLLISEFETEQCDRKLELLSIYKNTTLNDLNNIETNLQLHKKLFSESDINELESNYKISCIDSNDLINQIIR